MGRFSLDIETATEEEWSDLKNRDVAAGLKDLHNAIWCLGLDLEVGSSGVVEILVEELVGWVRTSTLQCSFGDRDRMLTSFAGLAMSLKGTGIPDMATTAAEEYEVEKEKREGSHRASQTRGMERWKQKVSVSSRCFKLSS